MFASDAEWGRGLMWTFPGSYGKQVHDKLVQHLIKMAEPPPSRLVKALPIPQETNRKKRGGKR